MPRSVQPKEMEEENNLLLAQGLVELLIMLRLGEQLLNMIEDPVVEIRRILREILELVSIPMSVHAPWNGAVLEHWKNVRAAPAPRMAASVENAVEIDWVVLPSCHDSRNILVQPGDERNVARAGLRRDARVGNAKGPMLENARS